MEMLWNAVSACVARTQMQQSQEDYSGRKSLLAVSAPVADWSFELIISLGQSCSESISYPLVSVTNLKVLAGWLDGALVAGRIVLRVLAACGFLQVQGQGRGGPPRLQLAAPPRPRVAGGRGSGSAVGRHRRRRLATLRRPSLSCVGAQIDLHSH